MNTSPPPPAPASPRPRLSLAFALWLAVGAAFVASLAVCNWYCPAYEPNERLFRSFNPSSPTWPQTQARYAAIDLWVPRSASLGDWSLAWALIGALAFYRRGWVVFVIAVGVYIACQALRVDVAIPY